MIILGMKCGVSETNLKMSLLMYSSYFVLFAKFFYNTYVGAGTAGKGKTSSAGEMIMKIEKKIQQQTDELVKASSGVSLQETVNNCEPSQQQAVDDIGKSSPANILESTNEEEEKQLKVNKKVPTKQMGKEDTMGKGVKPFKIVHQNISSDFADQEVKEETKSLDNGKLDDNINATSTSHK